ncbi:RE1, partial [Symbiodinium microadriaticum]
SAKVAHPASYLDFNEAVAIDVIWLSTSDSETARLPALNIVDLASTYQVVVLMESTKSAAAAKAFTQGWLHWAGAPKMVLADLDSAFKDKFAELLDRHRVGMRCSAGQAHWQNGVAERHGASWKAIWDKVVAAQGTLTEEAEETAAAVNDAKNTLRNHAGFSPRQWLFGSNDHRGDDYEQAVGETESPFDTTTPATKFGRLQALRLAAKTAFFETKAKEAVQRAGSHKPRVEGAAFEPGSLVYIYRLLRPGKGKKPKNTWLGPATVIGREGSNYWLARGGRCLLEVNEMLRVKLAKEADPDQYEVMSEGQDMEVDDLQAPPEGGGITMDAEMDFEGGIPREHGDDVPRSIKRLRLDPTPVGSARPPETSSVAASSSAGQLQTANMMVHRASEKGREKQREKELKWHEIPPQEQSLYVSAEKQQWDEHVKYEAVRALSLEESARVRREVPSSRILRSRFAYRDKNYSKRKADPNLGPKPKARLCVAGQTDPDLGTKDLMVDAPTASRHSILLACQLALERQWSASIGDISAAFLNGIKAPRQLYFEQPRRGIPSLEKGQLVEILKGVFGLSTSPKLWWLRLSEELLNLELSFGGEKVKTVQLRRGESSRRTHGVILTHVDDLLLMSEPGLQKPIQELLGSKFPIDGWEDNEFEYIGCEYKFTKAPDSDEASPEQIEENRTSVGSLSWLAKQTRPDLQFSVASCQRCQNHPTVKDLKATNKAVAAAKQHKDEALVLRRIGETNLAICVYHDAAWANVPDDAANEEDDAWLGGHSVASQLGYLVMAMGTQAIAGEESAFSLLDWRSKASSRVCRSTFAGETMSCGEGLESALYLRSLLIGMITGEAANEETAAWYVPIHLFTDCRSLYDHVHREGAPKAPSEKRLAIDLAALRQTLMREAKVQWLQKHGPEVTLTPERPLRPPLHWVPTEDQLADMMTKAMRPDAWRMDEEIAAHCHSAYLAYQSAKDRYKEAVRGRGVDQDAVKQRNEQRLKEAKARSYCSACKRRGHWHKDPECPLRGKVAPPKAEHERPHQAQMCNHVFVTSWCRPGACEKSSPDNADGYEDVPVDDGPRDTTDYQDELQTKGPQEPHGGATQDAEAKLVMMTAGGAEDGARGRRLNATTMNAIVDTACTRTVAGHDWYEEYCRLLDKAGQAPKIIEAVDHFKFGASKVHVSKFSVDAWFSTQGKAYVVNVAVVPCRVPLLFSRPVLAALGACYDIGAQKMSLAKLGLSEVPLIMGDTGHPVIPVDQFLGGRIPDIAVPVFEDAWIPAAQTEYKGVFAASASPSSPAPDPTTKRGIFYPKKLDPTIMSMVSGEWDLGGHTFFTWWRGAKQSRDFWVETESELIRVHVVPRKHTFNPSLWTTKYAHLKDALLDELADTRCTDVIPCLSEGVVLKRFQDVWLQSEDVKQDEILEELGSYNVLVHPRWTVPELRDILIEQRQTHGVPKAAAPDPMKGISKMTLDELVAEAQKQHITLPPKPTKGALLRMLRDSKSTEADTVVPFGKYKTWYYRELPRGYLQWAVQETKSGGSHPDLVRLANWAKTVLTDPAPPDEKEKKETLEDPETTAKTPPPRMERRLRDVPLSSDGSWAPVNFRPKPRQSRTREDSSSDSMDQEASGETMLEIAAIEARLAALKQKHGVRPKAAPRDRVKNKGEPTVDLTKQG